MDSSALAAAVQDGATSLYHNNITPFIQRCASYVVHQQPNSEPQIQSLASKRALQHSDNLKWQQDMFHRLLHLLNLSKEGLASEQQLASCKHQVLAFLESMHPDGEWPEFTRDKLLFLQDLLFSACISESEYHVSKKPLILRLADQGAILDAEDFIFDSNIASEAKIKCIVRTASTRRAKARSMAYSDISRTPSCKADANTTIKTPSSSPLKQVMGAVCRLNKTSNGSSKALDGAVRLAKESTPPKVPHALDFLRPEHCPVRDPPSPHQACQQRTTESPVSLNNQEEILPAMLPASSRDDDVNGDVCNWFTSPPSSPKSSLIPDAVDPLLRRSSSLSHSIKSPAGGTPSRLRNVLTGLMSRKTMQTDAEKSSKALQSSKGHNTDGEEERGSPVIKGSKWGLEILRIPRKLQFEQEENLPSIPKKTSCETDIGISVEQVRPIEGAALGSPLSRKHMKKGQSKAASSDFIIDKVLGENIKNELSRIRAEMNKAQPGQTFSNEQIDAIATKLPMDKAELKKFFPQTWCEKYGDVVLDVVHKEFNEHVGEMQKFRKGRDKQHVLASSSPSTHNDENVQVLSPLEQHHHNKQHLLPKRHPDFSKCFTTRDENSPISNVESPLSPNVEKSKCKGSSQHRHIRTLTKDMTSLDHKLEEEILKMPLYQMNEYGSHLRT